MAAIAADRNLLFGLLALQNGLIDQGQLVAAFQAWTLDKTNALADHLVSRDDLNAEDRSAVEAIVARHIKKHGGDVERSLAAIPAGRSTRESLARIDDPDVGGTLVHLGSASTRNGDDADRTASYAVGEATSGGQRFRVLRPHARGGLGAVFVALDAELHREVALKQILDSHADDPVSRQRFLLEAEITGGLEHPGIVPVYGLGTYGDGRPYYAMRFVKGDSLKEAIDRFHDGGALKADPSRRSLELRKLLRRFTDICNAIDYAHSRGVLHRDIKPGNIIVGKHGETLVVDWGLAKAVGRVEPGAGAGERTLVPSSASGSADTLPGSALGTPAYMSPEQAEGDLEHLSVKSDVYSLGGTLYYLLTGRPPFEGDIGEVVRAVQRGAIRPPRQVDPSIDRALEAVCLKAMAHNPADRFATPKALAEDVERWMADEPVSAWREPISRRARRWAKRNRTAVTAAAVALLAGVVGLSAVLVVQTRAKADIARALGRETTANAALAAANDELTRSKAAVQARYDLAVEAIKTFHTGVSEDFLLRQEQFKELRDRLLRSASDFYGRLGGLLGRETDLASRRALATTNFELAELTARIGRKEDAMVTHRAVLSAREAMSAESGDDTGLTVEIGRSLMAVGDLLEKTGKTGEALATYLRAEALVSGPAASDIAAKSVLAACRVLRGRLLYDTGRPVDALEAYRLARTDQEALVGAARAPIEMRRDLAETIGRIGNLLADIGRLPEAEAECRSALAIAKKAVDEAPSVARFRKELLDDRCDLAMILHRTGRIAEAEAEFRAALAMSEEIARAYPAVTEFRRTLAILHSNLGFMLSETGRPAEAETEYRADLAIMEDLARANPTLVEFRSMAADSRTRLALLLSGTGRPLEAETELRRAQVIYRELTEANPAVTRSRTGLASSHIALGQLLWATGQLSAAEAEFRAAIEHYRALAEANPVVTFFRHGLADSRTNLGNLLNSTGRPQAAEAEYRAAQGIYRALAEANPIAGEFRGRLAMSYHDLGALLSQTGRPQEAEVEHRQGLAILRRLAEETPGVTEYRSRLVRGHIRLGWLLSQMGRPAEAEAEYRRSLAVCRDLAEANPGVTEFRGLLAEGHSGLGLVLGQTRRSSEAEAEHRATLAIVQGLAEAEPGNLDRRREVGRCLNNLGDLDTDAGRLDAAAARFRESAALHERLAVDSPHVTDYRSGLAFALTGLGRALHRAGRSMEADGPLRRAAALREAIPNLNLEARFDLARDLALLATVPAGARPSRDAAEAWVAADRAMDALRQAVAAGYRDDPARVRDDPDLAALRGRADFRSLMMDLAMPPDPFARGD